MDPAKAPPTSLPVPPASTPDVGAPSTLASAVPGILQGVLAAFGLTPEAAASLAGKFLGEVLTPIIRQEIQDAFKMFKSTSEIGGANAQLDSDWDKPAPPTAS